jgi:hypothetical protein
MLPNALTTIKRSIRGANYRVPFAARVGHTTGHGTPLSPEPGNPTVFIGGMPAWRALPTGFGGYRCFFYLVHPWFNQKIP